MRILYTMLIIFSILFSTSMANPQQDLVTEFYFPYHHDWYSGYLNFTMGSFHYVYFQSQHDPSNDPLVLWLNGGPGCSSMLGMLYENGPFIFIPNTTELHLNKYSWNNKANLLYIESPGRVGFSKGDRQIYDDNNTAKDNLAAILAFFKKFPQLRRNDFYLTGESYSGIYVPYLAYQIIKYNKLPASAPTYINLRGIMVGNACTHPKQCYDATAAGNSMFQYQFLYNHGFYSDSQYSELIEKCTLDFFTPDCFAVREYMDKTFDATQADILNIYGPCYRQSFGKKMRTQKIHTFSSSQEGLKGDTDCADFIGILRLLNDQTITENLHVDPVEYQPCSDDIGDTYVSNANASYWIYPELMKQNMRVWVYSGDVDADVPITGTVQWLSWIKKQKQLPTLQKWRRWWISGNNKNEDQVGGMYWELEGITFVSVKGAGHMVPQDKPASAAVLLEGFLAGQPLPDKKC